MPPERSPARWLMLALVWSLYACFGLTQGSIPPLVGPVVEDLGMTYGQMGVVLGIWQLVYIGTSSPLGTLVDRWGVRRSMAAGLALILLSLVLRGLAVDFYTLLLAVALFGVGGPIISIGSPKVVALWFQGRERGTGGGSVHHGAHRRERHRTGDGGRGADADGDVARHCAGLRRPAHGGDGGVVAAGP